MNGIRKSPPRSVICRATRRRRAFGQATEDKGETHKSGFGRARSILTAVPDILKCDVACCQRPRRRQGQRPGDGDCAAPLGRGRRRQLEGTTCEQTRTLVQREMGPCKRNTGQPCRSQLCNELPVIVNAAVKQYCQGICTPPEAKESRNTSLARRATDQGKQHRAPGSPPKPRDTNEALLPLIRARLINWKAADELLR